MNDEIKTITHDAAKFWYEAWQYFESISLLAEAIANQLEKDGYNPKFQSYGLKFAAYDRGETRLVYDRLKNQWIGRFSIFDTIEKEENITYGFGITFGFNDPVSSVEPWIPIVYIFKSKVKENSEWKDWDYRNLLASPCLLTQLKEENDYIVKIDVSNYDAIEYLNVLRFPLGAVRTTDDVSKIIKPSVEALRHNNEMTLIKIQDFLLPINDEWKMKGD